MGSVGTVWLGKLDVTAITSFIMASRSAVSGLVEVIRGAFDDVPVVAIMFCVALDAAVLICVCCIAVSVDLSP